MKKIGIQVYSEKLIQMAFIEWYDTTKQESIGKSWLEFKDLLEKLSDKDGE